MADRVLLVEDDHTVRALVRLLLDDEGYEVVEAATGTQAVERFSAESFDLVLLDLRLPGLSGFDVCRAIRRTSEVPVIMVTAQQDSADVVAGLELGADDYITKPFNDRELLARVRVQLRRRHAAAPTGATYSVGDVTVRPDEGRAFKHDVELPLTKTEFQSISNTTGFESQFPSFAWTSVDSVAKAGLRGVAKGKVVIVPGLLYKVLAAISQVTPRRVQRRLVRVLTRR